MKRAFSIVIALAMLASAVAAPPGVLSFTVNNINGQPVNLSKYLGKVVLIVNVASECGYTPQYAGLEVLHERYAAKGLSILGFPSNDFGNQEPGSNGEIQQFCKANYGVQFDMFSKVEVLGDEKIPLYQYLTEPKTDPKFSGEIAWNFEKFLIGRDGQIIARFLSPVEPESPELTSAIDAALAKK